MKKDKEKDPRGNIEIYEAGIGINAQIMKWRIQIRHSHIALKKAKGRQLCYYIGNHCLLKLKELDKTLLINATDCGNL